MPKIVNHAERREQIVRIVAEMLVTVGVEKTTIREISRQSGYSRGFIEHYIPNKETLISESVRWITERSTERANRKLKGKRGLEALRVMNQLILPLDQQGHKDWIIRLQFWSLAALDPTYRKRQSDETRIALRLYVRYLQQAQEAGDVDRNADVETMATELLHRIFGLSCDAILRPRTFTRKRQLEELEHIIQSMVKP